MIMIAKYGAIIGAYVCRYDRVIYSPPYSNYKLLPCSIYLAQDQRGLKLRRSWLEKVLCFKVPNVFLALEEVLRWLKEVLKWLKEVLKWVEEVLNSPPNI